MKAVIEIDQQKFHIDLSKPIDISIPIRNNEGVNAWYVDHSKIEPQQLGDWVGSTEKGAAVNFNQIQFNPHSHGTHTESIGHILSNAPSINKVLNEYFFRATLITISPIQQGDDFKITKEVLEKALVNTIIHEALIIRLTPNTEKKKAIDYSNTNWPYFTKEAIQFIVDHNVLHLLVDTPSIDKENDEGKLEAHHTFWQTDRKTRIEATITELAFIPNEVEDGNYLLNLQVAAFENNAAPSRPILFNFI